MENTKSMILSLHKKFLADLVTFTEEIRNGKLYFLCSVYQVPFRELWLILELAFLPENTHTKINSRICIQQPFFTNTLLLFKIKSVISVSNTDNF